MSWSRRHASLVCKISVRLGAPKESKRCRVGWFVSADAVRERIEGATAFCAKVERSVAIWTGSGEGRYRARMRRRAGSLSCGVWEGSCGAYWGGTVGGVWKKPVVAEEGLRLDILFSGPAWWQMAGGFG